LSKYYKERPIERHEAIKQRIIGAIKNIEAIYALSSALNHNLSKGEYREKPIQDFFKELLPNKFDVSSGEVIDYKGKVSSQSDVIIYRNLDGIPILQSEPTILQIESIMSIIEVKSTINVSEYEDCLKKIKKLYTLKPFGNNIQQYERGRIPHKKDVRVFTSIFAYSSDSNMSLNDELSRYLRKANEIGIDPTLIDRIYILNKGVINPSDRVYSDETEDKRAFFYFYSNLLQFIMRESRRRDEVPYLDYFGRMTGGWEKYEPI